MSNFWTEILDTFLTMIKQINEWHLKSLTNALHHNDYQYRYKSDSWQS